MLKGITLLFAFFLFSASAQARPALQEIGSFDQPVFVTQPAGKGGLTVVEQTGKIKMKDKNGHWRTFLDVSDKISCCGEQGLLGLAFSENYRTDRRLYINYTNHEGDTRVVEYKRSQKSIYKASKNGRTVLRINQPYSNHNGGALAVSGKYLYIATGDGGGGGDPDNNAQNTNSLLGKILRIDPRPQRGEQPRPYRVPDSNPFVGRSGSDLVYSYGLRNPWRFSITDQQLIIGDVGQGEWEEVNRVSLQQANGANFGWSRFEGSHIYDSSRQAPNALFPQIEYSHNSGGCSVVGGYLVQDATVPSLNGKYLYGDFCQGQIRAHSFSTQQNSSTGLSVSSLSSFGTDNRRRVYAVSLSGSVYRIVERTPSRLQARSSEWQITLSRISISAGEAIIELLNRGEDAHDLKMYPVNDPEQQISFPETESGGLSTVRTELEPGQWYLYCSLPGHEQLGMHASLTVR